MDIAGFSRQVTPPQLNRIVRGLAHFDGGKRIFVSKHFQLDPHELPALWCGLEEKIPEFLIEVSDD